MSYAFRSAQFGQFCANKRRPAASRCVVARVDARPLWLPGSEPPVWLDGTMIGDYGYDPLSLGKNPTLLARFQEGEIMNGRWAMLGAAGMAAVELFGQGTWRDAPNWAITGGKPTYFGVELPFDDVGLISVIEFVLIGAAEGLRGAEPDREKRMYPGGAFDPMGMSKNDKKFETLKLKELNNGRLAMVACLGFWLQASATKKGPIQNLVDHITNPMVNNVGNNGISVPAAGFNLPDFA